METMSSDDTSSLEGGGFTRRKLPMVEREGEGGGGREREGRGEQGGREGKKGGEMQGV
jgi:hypothetical protein